MEIIFYEGLRQDVGYYSHQGFLDCINQLIDGGILPPLQTGGFAFERNESHFTFQGGATVSYINDGNFSPSEGGLSKVFAKGPKKAVKHIGEILREEFSEPSI